MAPPPSTHRRQLRALLLAAALLASPFLATAAAPVVAPAFAGQYTLRELGQPVGVPTNYGGIGLLFNDPNVVILGGAANQAGAAIYKISVARDPVNKTITGFTSNGTVLALAPRLDGGLNYGPQNVLFVATYNNNRLLQIKPGSGAPDKTINLNDFSISSSVGVAGFVPAGLPGAGRLKIASYNTGDYYDVGFVPDGSGTFNLTSATLKLTLPGGPEGIAWIPPGSPLFPNPALVVAEYDADKIAVYDIDANGDPILATRRAFVNDIDRAEGAYFDVVSGDLLFSTFGGGNKVLAVSGFAVPAVACGAGACCNVTAGIVQPAGTPCGATANPCVVNLCDGTNSTCPAATTTLPNGTPCTFAAPTSGNKCRDRGADGKADKCPHKHYGSLATCAGTCQGGACILVRAPNAKCCKLAAPASQRKPCYCRKH